MNTVQRACEPQVSVLMLVYNHGPYLAKAIEGVLMQQTSFPFELIIGEDSSLDDSYAIAERFQRMDPKRVRIVTSDTNVGMHRNFWRVFDARRADIVSFCEGDDYWISSTKLQEQYEVLQRCAAVSAVFSDFLAIGARKGVWRADSSSALADVNLSRLRGWLSGLPEAGKLRTLTCTLRATVVSHLRERGLPTEDYPFLDNFLLAEAMVRGEIECLPQVTAVYRRTPESATRTGVAGNLRFLQQLEKFNEHFTEYFPELGPIDSRTLRSRCIDICRSAYVAGDVWAYNRALERLRRLGTSAPAYLELLKYLVRQPQLRRVSVALYTAVRKLQAAARKD